MTVLCLHTEKASNYIIDTTSVMANKFPVGKIFIKHICPEHEYEPHKDHNGKPFAIGALVYVKHLNLSDVPPVTDAERRRFINLPDKFRDYVENLGEKNPCDINKN